MALRTRLPAEVRRALRGERALGWGRWQVSRYEEGFAVATMRALHLLHGAGDDLADAEIPWHTVIRAQWHEPVLEVLHHPGVDAPPVTRAITLPEPGRLPDAVRDRVTANIVMSVHVPLVGAKGARFVARRRPDASGVRWTVVFDTGLDASDPELRGRAEQELERLRVQMGA